MINEIKVTELLDSSSVTFEWSYNINGVMICRIFTGKVKLLSNLFQFSNVNRSVKNGSRNLNFCLGANLRLFMSFRLFNMFFLNDRFSRNLRNLFFLNFTVDINASY